jgi:hypothetical protein
MTYRKLTKQEKNAIRCLKNLAKRWPDSLWLFSAARELCVMRYNNKREVAVTNSGGVDQDYVVADINIPNDGGDW